jgi:short-chain fatty acids transporter
MQGANAAGISLASVFPRIRIHFNHKDIPAVSFLSAGIVNLFVPSGGGHGRFRVLLGAGGTGFGRCSQRSCHVDRLGATAGQIDPAILGTASAWHRGLKRKRYYGYCLMATLWTGIIIVAGFCTLHNLKKQEKWRPARAPSFYPYWIT